MEVCISQRNVVSQKRCLVYGSVYRSKKRCPVYGTCVYMCCHKNAVSFMEVCKTVYTRVLNVMMVHVKKHTLNYGVYKLALFTIGDQSLS